MLFTKNDNEYAESKEYAANTTYYYIEFNYAS